LSVDDTAHLKAVFSGFLAFSLDGSLWIGTYQDAKVL
jgi:hypothetical protein